MGNTETTFKVDYKAMIKSWGDVLSVVKALVDQCEDQHITKFIELNRKAVPDKFDCKTVEEAKTVLAGIASIMEADWLVMALRHVEGMSATTLSITTDLPPKSNVMGLEDPELDKHGWSEL
jgi:hypothetical protein